MFVDVLEANRAAHESLLLDFADLAVNVFISLSSAAARLVQDNVVDVAHLPDIPFPPVS